MIKRSIRSITLNSDELDLNRSVVDYVNCYGGGGKAPSVETVETAPPPPPPAQEATLQPLDDPNDKKKKQKATAQGAKSLQIPLVGDVSGATVGTA